jgi:hypothetical protein
MKYSTTWINTEIKITAEKIDRDKFEEDKVYIHVDRLSGDCQKFLNQFAFDPKDKVIEAAIKWRKEFNSETELNLIKVTDEYIKRYM